MESSSPSTHQANVYFDALPYVRKLIEQSYLIVAITFVVMVATAAYDILFATRWYLAKALIRPIATSVVESRIAGFSGGLGGGMANELGGLAQSFGGGGGNDADEYLAILKSVSFNINMAERHHLAAELLKPSRLGDLIQWLSPLSPKWRLYHILDQRFDLEYSRSTGNMEVTYISPAGPADAERVLNYYIDDLRELLRSREIVDAAAAVVSLREEAAGTADPMLRSELYVLEAKQIQRKKMAQVEAEFAFRVLDPPAAPDKRYRPKLTLDCTIAGLLAAFAAAALVLLRMPPPQGEGRNITTFVRPVGLSARKADPAG